MKPGLVLLGGGGHCRSVIEVVERQGAYSILGVLDPGAGADVLGYPVLGGDDLLPALAKQGHAFLVTVGQIRSPDQRMALFGRVREAGGSLATVVSPSAEVSRHAVLGPGTAVMHRAVVNAGARVGENSIVNTGAIIEHDADVGAHCHVSTGALVNGGAVVEAGSFIGSRAVVREGVRVGARCVVGAGALVMAGLPEGTVWKAGAGPLPAGPVTLIAEAGVNHNGSLDLALSLVDAAAEAGADYVKFQTFDVDLLVTRNAAKAEYQKARAGGGTQRETLERLTLSADDHRTILARSRERGIGFLSSAFDLPSIGFLESLGLTLWKVPSGEITHLAYLRKIGSLGGRVILSTGMATLAEIGAALDVLSKSGTPRENVTVLQCHTEYPTAFADANIRAMDTIARAFGVAVGFSDHTPGIEASVAAVALGATIIEKHLTLDKNLPGPDHAASLVPAEMAALVSAVRNVEKALGDGVKAPTPAEERNRLAARKSLVAARAVRKGEPFTPENVIAKRPGTGVSPMEADRWMGRVATRDYEPDEPL